MPLSVPSPPTQTRPSIWSLEPVGHSGDGLDVVAVDVVARGPQDRPAPGRVEFGDLVEQRVQVDVGHLVIQQAAEPLDDAEDLDPGLVGPLDGAYDGRVEGGRVAARRQDADPLHRLSSSVRPPHRRGKKRSGQRVRKRIAGNPFRANDPQSLGRGGFQRGSARAAFHRDKVAEGHLPPFAGLDLAIDPDPPVGDEGLGLTAGADPAGEFQDLRQVDRRSPTLNGSVIAVPVGCRPFPRSRRYAAETRFALFEQVSSFAAVAAPSVPLPPVPSAIVPLGSSRTGRAPRVPRRAGPAQRDSSPPTSCPEGLAKIGARAGQADDEERREESQQGPFHAAQDHPQMTVERLELQLAKVERNIHAARNTPPETAA